MATHIVWDKIQSFTGPREVAEHFRIGGQLCATNSIMFELYTHSDVGESVMFYSNQTDNVCYCVGAEKYVLLEKWCKMSWSNQNWLIKSWNHLFLLVLFFYLFDWVSCSAMPLGPELTHAQATLDFFFSQCDKPAVSSESVSGWLWPGFRGR